jgi:hypothetical protein
MYSWMTKTDYKVALFDNSASIIKKNDEHEQDYQDFEIFSRGMLMHEREHLKSCLDPKAPYIAVLTNEPH